MDQLYFKESRQISSVNLSCKEKKIWNKIKSISVFIKNGIIYVCKKKNYLYRKYKDFQLFMLKEGKASKKRIYMVHNILEKMSGGD